MKLFRYICFACALCCAVAVAAEDSLEEAGLLMRSGEVEEAISMLERLEEESPKNGELNMMLGDCYVMLNESARAIEQYRAAQKKGVNDAWLSLAELATLQYRVDDAEEDIELYREGLKKGRKTLPDNSGDVVAKLDRTRNMLDRVEKIVIVDSINVDAESFFEAYRLSFESGKLLSPDVLPDDVDPAYPSVVFMSETGGQRIFSVSDENQNYKLVSQAKLFGGKWEAPRPLGDLLNEGGDANYPFLMPDGVTLYYANDGENSLGGYDIFISRRGDNGFLEPQNIGMPYNSPYNDYMLAIDELNGIGWWATDRNHIPGMVTIYVFIPSDMRINYAVDDPNLASRARIDDIRDTWGEGRDYSDLVRKISLIPKSENPGNDDDGFMLSVPGRGVLTSYSRFNNSDARREMKLYMKELDNYNKLVAQLKNLRRRFASGETMVAEEITDLEVSQRDARESLVRRRNNVIMLETNQQ